MSTSEALRENYSECYRTCFENPMLRAALANIPLRVPYASLARSHTQNVHRNAHGCTGFAENLLGFASDLIRPFGFMGFASNLQTFPQDLHRSCYGLLKDSIRLSEMCSIFKLFHGISQYLHRIRTEPAKTLLASP